MNRSFEKKLPKKLRVLEFVKACAPADSVKGKPLPFDRLDPGVFERLCCQLVYGKYEDKSDDISIHMIGEKGQAQYGADIFVQRDSEGESLIELFEVKRVERFYPSDYEKVIDRFVQNFDKWKQPKRFTMIISSPLSAAVIQKWISKAEYDLEDSIKLNIWSLDRLLEEIEEQMHLVFEYFDKSWVEHYCGAVGLYHFEKYGVFGFEESPHWDEYQDEYVKMSGEVFIVQNDHVRLQAFLPSFRRNGCSCFVVFRNKRFEHVLMTIEHEELLDTYFVGCGSPAAEGVRKFLIQSHANSNEYICDISNCRISLSSEEAEAFCAAMDIFFDAYSGSVLDLETAYESVDFPTYEEGLEDVPLLVLPLSVWGLVRRFINVYDVLDGDSDWHIFNSPGVWLNVFTRHKTNEMDHGSHLTIKPRRVGRRYVVSWASSEDIILYWAPPGGLAPDDSSQISPRRYWPARHAHDWIQNELLPQVLWWHYKRLPWRKRLFNKMDHSMFRQEVKDGLWSESLIQGNPFREVDSIESLYEAVSALQSFYHSKKTGTTYIDPKSYRDVFSALYMTLERSENLEYDYLNGNLSYLNSASVEELLDMVKEHSEVSNEPCTNLFKIDCLMRSFMSALRGSKSFLNKTEVHDVMKKLRPLVKETVAMDLVVRQKMRIPR